MVIRRNDVLEIVFQRVVGAHPLSANFGHSEICSWPKGALKAFLQSGFLVEGEQAQSLICPGCEWQCQKVPTIRADENGIRRIYISCDEEPRYGRISVSAERLDQYKTDIRTLSVCFAKLMASPNMRALQSGNGYNLGAVRGRHGERLVGILVSDVAINLTVGRQIEPLQRFVSLRDSGLTLNFGDIKKLANRKEHTRHVARVPNRSRQQKRKRVTQARDNKIYQEASRRMQNGESLTSAAKSIADSHLAENLSPSRVRRIITEKQKNERKN